MTDSINFQSLFMFSLSCHVSWYVSYRISCIVICTKLAKNSIIPALEIEHLSEVSQKSILLSMLLVLEFLWPMLQPPLKIPCRIIFSPYFCFFYFTYFFMTYNSKGEIPYCLFYFIFIFLEGGGLCWLFTFTKCS